MITIEPNIQNNDTTTVDSPVFTTGDEFWTKGKSALKKFTINNEGDATAELCISFYDVPDDTSIKNFPYFPENSVQKLFYKIISINDLEEAIVEIYLENGETQKKLNKYYSSILKNKNLFYEGAEFYIAYEKITDGLKIQVEPYSIDLNENILYDSIYKKLVD